MSFPFELDLTASTSADERPSLLRAATMMFPQPLSQIEGIGQDDEDTVMLFYAPDEQDEDDHDEGFEPYPYGEVETAKRLDVDHAWNAIVQAKELDAIEEQIYQDKIFAKAKAAAIAKQVEEAKAKEAMRKQLVASYTKLLESDDDEDLFSDDEITTPLKRKAKEEPKPIQGKVRSSGRKSSEKPIVAETKHKETGPRAMRWMFTWNGKSEDDAAYLATDLTADVHGCKGYAFQMEVGESGNVHIQGYIEMKDQLRAPSIKALFDNTVHVEVAKKPKLACVRYCTKLDTRKEGCKPYTWGTCTKENESVGQGRRTDIEKFSERVLKDGITIDLIEEQPGMMMQYNKHAKELLNLKRSLEMKQLHKEMIVDRIAMTKAGHGGGMKPRELVLLFGPSAVGKTTWCENICVETYNELPYSKDGKSKWWCMYEYEQVVLVDEWRKEFSGDLQTFNWITNYCPAIVEVKGGAMRINPKAMLFTSNRHPRDIFDITDQDEASFNALMRRFAVVHWWNEAKELTTLDNPGIKPNEEDFEGEFEYELALDEWNTKAKPWFKFWTWKARQAEAGDTFDPTNRQYFNL